jgi:hypothetical protein
MIIERIHHSHRQERWRVACHEAGHAVGFTQLCGVKSWAELFRNGGCCWHDSIPASQPHRAWLRATAAGRWCEIFATRWPMPIAPRHLPTFPPPAGFAQGKTDGAMLTRAFTIIGRNRDEVTESVAPFNDADAEAFRLQYEMLVVPTAQRLFIAGEITLFPAAEPGEFTPTAGLAGRSFT